MGSKFAGLSWSKLAVLGGMAMAALSFGEVQAAPITKQVTIKPILVCDDAGANCAGMGFFEAATDKIWSQAGIDIKFLAAAQLNETDYLIVNADTVAAGGHPANEHVSLFNDGNALVGDPFVTKIINMYFVDAMVGGFFGLGCGAAIYAGFCGNEAGIIIADEIFAIPRLDTIAHEIGHVLGLTHDDFGAGAAAPKNLMTSGSFRIAPSVIGDITPDGQGLDLLTQAQIDVVLLSQFVADLQIPEPASLVLLGLGLAGIGFVRRRKAA